MSRISQPLVLTSLTELQAERALCDSVHTISQPYLHINVDVRKIRITVKED